MLLIGGRHSIFKIAARSAMCCAICCTIWYSLHPRGCAQLLSFHVSHHMCYAYTPTYVLHVLFLFFCPLLGRHRVVFVRRAAAFPDVHLALGTLCTWHLVHLARCTLHPAPKAVRVALAMHLKAVPANKFLVPAGLQGSLCPRACGTLVFILWSLLAGAPRGFCEALVGSGQLCRVTAHRGLPLAGPPKQAPQAFQWAPLGFYSIMFLYVCYVCVLAPYVLIFILKTFR